jgi:hypothetical protein
MLVICFLGGSVLAQKKLVKQGDKYYNAARYNEASALYKKVYDKKPDPRILIKLADCNYLNENYRQAEYYYAMFFSDTLYRPMDQFTNYARSAEKNGKLRRAAKLYQLIYNNTLDANSKLKYELFKFYLDSIAFHHAKNLDANHNCIVIDARASFDSLAAPLDYLWDLGDGNSAEGLVLEHCYGSVGEHQISLSVMDRLTGMIKKNDTVLVVTTAPPFVQFKGPGKGKKFIYLEFENSTVVPADMEVLDLIWDMGNGDNCKGNKIRYRYANAGSFDVRLALITKNRYHSAWTLFSSFRKIEVEENYNVQGKTFSDVYKEAK